jgi:hypothetical protein
VIVRPVIEGVGVHLRASRVCSRATMRAKDEY